MNMYLILSLALGLSCQYQGMAAPMTEEEVEKVKVLEKILPELSNQPVYSR